MLLVVLALGAPIHITHTPFILFLFRPYSSIHRRPTLHPYHTQYRTHCPNIIYSPPWTPPDLPPDFHLWVSDKADNKHASPTSSNHSTPLHSKLEPQIVQRRVRAKERKHTYRKYTFCREFFFSAIDQQRPQLTSSGHTFMLYRARP